MGQNLARQWQQKYPDIIPDVVIPAPFTANTAALSFAHEVGVRYSEGLYKNPFIGRTFIMPNQEARSRGVRYKLTPQKTEIENKKVLIVDDSIVRGTTSREIVKMVREFGAKEIYFVSSCPPIIGPCFYGIDIPSRNELIAANDTEDQIRDFLGVDLLLYQTQHDLIEAVTRRGQHHITQPCMACMDGDYICGGITENKIQGLEKQREQGRGKSTEKGKGARDSI
jgi:amidophosphoribosyltransferase